MPTQAMTQTQVHISAIRNNAILYEQALEHRNHLQQVAYNNLRALMRPSDSLDPTDLLLTDPDTMGTIGENLATLADYMDEIDELKKALEIPGITRLEWKEEPDLSDEGLTDWRVNILRPEENDPLHADFVDDDKLAERICEDINEWAREYMYTLKNFADILNDHLVRNLLYMPMPMPELIRCEVRWLPQFDDTAAFELALESDIENLDELCDYCNYHSEDFADVLASYVQAVEFSNYALTRFAELAPFDLVGDEPCDMEEDSARFGEAFDEILNAFKATKPFYL